MINKILKLSVVALSQCVIAATQAAQLEEVLVTAQKKVQSVQDIPVAIGVVSGDDLSKFSITSTSDLDDATPGLVIQEAPGNLSTITLRGVGTAPGNESFDQSVSLFVDGVWAGRQREFSSALFDIERVEVIKGTQNALLGKNTSLGAISLITKSPGDEFGGYINTEYEFEYGSQLVSAAVDVPVGDNLRTRLAINYKDKVGDVENIFTGNDVASTDQFAARFKAAFDIGYIGDAVFTYQADTMDILGDTFQFAFDDSHQIRDQAPGQLIGVGDKKSSYTSRGKDGDSFDTQDSQRANLTANFDIGDFQLTTVSGYSRYTNKRQIDADFSYKEYLYQETESDFEQFSQEFRITGPDLVYFDYTLGAFFLKNQFSKRIPTYATVTAQDAFDSLLRSGFNPLPAELGGDIDYGALAEVLGEEILPVLPGIIGNLIAGNGLVLDDLDFDQVLVSMEQVWKGTALNNNDLALFGLNGAFESFFDQSTYVSSFFGQSTIYLADNWNLTIGMRYTDEKKIATIERIELEPGLIHKLSYPLYDAERLSLREKSLDGSVNLQYFFSEENMAYITWGQGTKSGGFADQATLREDVPYDKEVAQTLEIGSKMTFLDGAARLNVAAFYTDIEDYQTVVFVGLGFETSNVQAESIGVEFDGQMALSEHLFLAGGATYAEASNKDTDLVLPLSPKLTANIGFHYERPLFGFDFSADLGANYRSKMYHNLKEARPASDAVTRYDARVALASEEDGWEFALVGKNLTDELSLAISGDVPGIADGSSAVAATEPRRTIAFQANYKF